MTAVCSVCDTRAVGHGPPPDRHPLCYQHLTEEHQDVVAAQFTAAQWWAISREIKTQIAWRL